MAEPRDFVLVPGAWMGAWAWDDGVAERLRAFGHRPHALTLTGLDAAAESDAAGIGLETHVADVVGFIESRDLQDVVLVGHSYSGIVAGLVADRMSSGHVARVVYVAAFLPRDGEAMLDAFPKGQRKEERREIEAHDGRWPAPGTEGLAQEKDLTEAQQTWLSERFVAHPGRTLTEPASLRRPLEAQRATYVACTLEPGAPPADLAGLRGEPTWTFRQVEAGHFPMVSVSEELAALLASVASTA